MKYITLLALLLVTKLTIAQNVIGPPSLSLGTDEVLFQKGVLDVELIGEIIAEKQDEIKKELAKRLILDGKLSQGPYLTYNYADIIEIKMSSKNQFLNIVQS